MASPSLRAEATVPTARALLRISAAGLALADGMIHAAVLGEHFQKAAYMGILFALATAFLGMLGIALAYPPYDSPRSAVGKVTRICGLLLMAGLIAGFFLTRTIGLPGFNGDWSPVGLTSVAMEALLFVFLIADLPGRGSGSRM